MLDDDNQLQALFSRIGQVVVFGQYLTAALQGCCTRIFIQQGFDEGFARAMMDHQEPETVRRTWTELMLQRFKDQPEATAPIQSLSTALDQAATARKELLAYHWLLESEKPAGFASYADLDGFTLDDGGVNFERLILDLANLASALRLLAESIETADVALLERLWGIVKR
jgi:hypothetical protein